MLSFIKECIFSPDWHSSIFKEACHQLNEERVSALLRMLQPQLSVDERMEGARVSDMSYEKHCHVPVPQPAKRTRRTNRRENSPLPICHTRYPLIASMCLQNLLLQSPIAKDGPPQFP